jgi:hypothetical protein
MSDFSEFFNPEPDPEVASLWEDAGPALRVVGDALKAPSVVVPFTEKVLLQKGSHERMQKLEASRLRGAKILKALRRARVVVGPTTWNVMMRVAPKKFKGWMARAARPPIRQEHE